MPASTFQQLYRSPYLSWARPGWRLSKRTYHALVNGLTGGVTFTLADAKVRVPSQYARLWSAREQYAEDASDRAIAQWCRTNPNGVFFDVGADIGKYSLLALTLMPSGMVVALDSSLDSLLVLTRICAGYNDRLRLVRGFVTEQGEGRSFDQASRETVAALRELEAKGEASPDYVVIGQSGTETIPTNRLDDLLLDWAELASRPVFLKMDIEGAEAMALAGAQKVLANIRPQMLVSIHPAFLEKYGSSKAHVLEVFSRAGYRCEMLSVDHEEHWLCKPAERVEQNAK